MISLDSFSNNLNVVVIGASGGIGHGFIKHLTQSDKVSRIYAFSRSGTNFDDPKILNGLLDYDDENSIETAAQQASQDGKIDVIIVATGALHVDNIQPEKALRDIDPENFARIFHLNATGPALVAKHFLRHIQKERKSVFAALSARVGSIDDNMMGGWYAYRAAKAALNMILKNTAIETARRYKEAVIVALHPGTVDTKLSAPFSGNVKPGKLFTTEHSTAQMLKVIDNISTDKTGLLIAYDGEVIPY